MGQIKNIKLHIVTDIKFRKMSSSEEEENTPPTEEVVENEENEEEEKKLAFADIGLNESLCEACTSLGWTHPSKIQTEPAFIGMESAGVHETTYNSIMKCD